MTQSYEYDGDALTRVRHSTVTLVQQAELLGVGISRLTYNDTPGTQEIVGQKDFAADQDDCANPVLYRGFVGETEFRRGLEALGGGREIDISLEDLNSIAGFRTFTGDDADDGDRPEEDVSDQLAWLESTGMLPGVFWGTRVHGSARIVEKTSYRDQTPSDVLAACALAAGGRNVYIRDFGDGDGPELVFRNDNESTDDTSTLSISNVSGEADHETVFPPLRDFVLRKKPGRVGSRMHYSYRGGRVMERREATADDFNGRRDLTVTNSSVKAEAMARLRAQDLLWQHHTEELIGEGSVLLPPEKVNLLAHGDRVGVRLRHLDNLGNGLSFYDPAELVYCRVLETRIKPMLKPTRLYEVGLKLSPQEEGPPAGAIVQRAFNRSQTQPLALPLPVTIDDGSGTRVLVLGIAVRDDPFPNEPTDDGGAWTRIPASDKVSAEHGSGDGSGIAFWWKVTDSTDNTFGRNDSKHWVAAVWELDGVDMTAATVVYLDDQSSSADPVVMAAGSLGTVAVGEIVVGGFVVVNKANTTGFGDYKESGIVAVAVSTTGLSQGIWNGPVDTNYGIWEAVQYPLAWFGDLEGDGSAVNPTIQRPAGLSSPPGGASAPTAWAAIFIKIPPA